jgi:parallel beta-helix repeat protein
MWGESISRYVAAHPLDQVFSYGYLNEKTIMEFVLLGDPTLGVRSNIHIKADGSVDPSTAPIHYDGNLYTLTDDIEDYSVVVERDNIVVDGAGHTLQGVGGGNGVTLTGRNNVKIINISIRKFSSGIVLSSSTNDTVAENIITGSGYGVYLDYSSNTNITGNNITANNWEGIYLGYSSNNSIIGNSVTGNTFDGIYLRSSSNNSIIGNYLKDNYNGIDLRHSSDNNSIYGNNITSNTRDGIELDYVANCNSIFGNSITSNVRNGIELWYSSDNNIYENAIAENKYGVWIGYSSNNSLCHNNFIDNTLQIQVSTMDTIDVWDDGYPSGGNYWSDYNGTDLYRGPYQNETGSDGTGDTPYIIDADNRDRYPLMTPYIGIHDVAVTCVVSSKTVVGQGFTVQIDVTITNQGDYPELLNMTLYANTTAITTFTRKTLLNGITITINLTWDTSGLALGNYTISASATAVWGETDTADNNFTDGTVLVSFVGDVNGDRKVRIDDILAVATAFESNWGEPKYSPNLDINDDRKIRVDDVLAAAQHFGQGPW